MEARRTRRELSWRPDVRLSGDDVYALVLAETGSEEAASEALRRHYAAQLAAGAKPE